MNEGVLDNNTEPEHCELLKAMYNFTSSEKYAKSLTFHVDDVFIIHEMSTKQRQWWEVVNNKGAVGYVPSNYVNTIQVTLKYFLHFLDGCIQVLRKEEESANGCLPADRRKLLRFLVERRNSAEVNCDNGIKRRAPVPPELSRTPGGSAFTSGGGDCDVTANPSGSTYTSVCSSSNNAHGGSVQVVASSLVEFQHKTAQSKHARAGLSTSDTMQQQSSKEFTNIDAKKKAASNTDIKTRSKNTKKEPHSNLNLDAQIVEKHSKSNMASHAAAAHSNSTNIEERNTCENHDADDTTRPRSTSPQLTPTRRKSEGSLIAYNLVEQIRHHTDLSHDLSCVALRVVLTNLRELLVPGVDALECVDSVLAQCGGGRLVAPRRLIEERYDAARLAIIFAELTSCKEDSQQRSWMVHEDEEVIVKYIKELTDILTNADPSISCHMMSLEHYDAVTTLVQYYQMEVRWSIRRLLLQTFAVMCHLDATVVTLMRNSILPMELAREMRDNARNVPRLMFTSLLLTMVFAMGQPMPIGHLEHMGLEFISFLFELIENPPDTDIEEQIPDKFINFILAFNLQFADPEENYVLKALEERDNAKTFTEKVLMLFNREEDPVRVFEHKPAPPHSVRKLFTDLFSNRKTADLFYTNDVRVLIDIVTRELSDLSAGDERRPQYLRLSQLFMRNSSYEEHQHRRDDLQKCFSRILREEADESRDDRRLVRAIADEFPQYFGT